MPVSLKIVIRDIINRIRRKHRLNGTKARCAILYQFKRKCVPKHETAIQFLLIEFRISIASSHKENSFRYPR